MEDLRLGQTLSNRVQSTLPCTTVDFGGGGGSGSLSSGHLPAVYHIVWVLKRLHNVMERH